MTDILSTELLRSYPRTRPPLTPAHEAVHTQHYVENRDGSNAASGVAQKLEQWLHRKVASVSGAPVLELGAGTLNHLQYENDLSAYDAVEPFSDLFEGRPERQKVRDVFSSAGEISDRRYARIISIAVLEHMTDLPAEIARSVLLLEEGGVFQAGIPSEGGFLWNMAWRFSTGIAYRLEHKLDYGVVMRHEHVNKAREIREVVQTFFGDVRVAKWPVDTEHLSFYQYLEARDPDRDLARKFLSAARPAPSSKEAR